MKKNDEIKSLTVELRKTWLEMDILYGIIETIGTEIDIQNIAKVIVDKITHSLRTKLTLLMLIDGSYLELKASAGIDSERIKEYKVPLDEGIMSEVIKTKRPQISKLVIKSKDIQLSYHSCLCVPLMIQNRPIGVIATCSKLSGENFTQYDRRVLYRIGIVSANILENMRLTQEQEREKLEREKAKWQAYRYITHGIAHHIRNILWILSGNVQLLLRSKDKNDIDKKLEMMERQIEEADMNIRRLMDSTGEIKPYFQKVNIEEIINKVLLILEPQLKNTGMPTPEVSIDIPEIKADELLLKEVFENIIKNAIESMKDVEKKRLTITASRINNKEVEIRFEDTGIGIAKENQPRLFEPFFSLKEGGVGLGLYFCKEIIEGKHGGSIKIESKGKSKGTTCTIRLSIST